MRKLSFALRPHDLSGRVGLQNTSHAVMAQRVEPKDSADDFPTPPWATQAVRIRRSQWLALDQASIPCARAGARREFIEVERQADGFRLVRLTEAGIEALDRASRKQSRR
jgi:hypothetical protein